MQLSSLFISLDHLVMLVLLFAGCFYQLAVFLYSPGQVWRIWQVLLWGVLMSYNVVSVIFPNEELPVPLSLQYIFRYGVGFLLGSCFPLYFYKAHGITEFAIHVRFGLPVCYGLPFLLFFVIMFPLGKDLELILYWVMALPVIYTYSLFGVLSVYFGETDHMIPLQIDHQICWRKPFANATEALTKVVI